MQLNNRIYTLYKKCKLNEGTKLQCAKKVVSDSPELVDFAIGLVNFVLDLPNGQLKFFEEVKFITEEL